MNFTNRLLAVISEAAPAVEPLFASPPVHDELREARGKRAIESARESLRAAQVANESAKREPIDIGLRIEHVAGLANAEKVDAAQDALETAQASRRSLRSGLLVAGRDIPPTEDKVFAAQERAAESALAEARLEVAAAEEALPSLRRQLTKAEDDARSAESTLSRAAWEVVLANLALATQDASALALKLTDQYRQLAAASELATHAGFELGGRVRLVPEEWVPRVEWQFDDLRGEIVHLKDVFRRLLSDADAAL